MGVSVKNNFSTFTRNALQIQWKLYPRMVRRLLEFPRGFRFRELLRENFQEF